MTSLDMEEAVECRNMESLICSICDSSFDIEGEGGINGFFGVCEVAFCVWCYASLTDMVESNCFQCQEKLEEGPSNSAGGG